MTVDKNDGLAHATANGTALPRQHMVTIEVDGKEVQVSAAIARQLAQVAAQKAAE